MDLGARQLLQYWLPSLGLSPARWHRVVSTWITQKHQSRVIQHVINTYSELNLTSEEIQLRAAKREDPSLCASSAIAAVQNLKRCTVDCNNVSGGARAGVSLHEVLKARLSQHFQQIRHPRDA